MLTRVPSSLIVWPTQRTVKSWLLAELAVAGHVRNDKCAITVAQVLVRNIGSSHHFVRNTGSMARRPELHDPRVLRAIAHPVRSRILTELDASGSLRAADVALLLGIPANSASFHLRQLAKFGLVEEDPEAARDKRDRVWKATEEDGYDVSLRRGGEGAGRQGRLRRLPPDQGRLGPPPRRPGVRRGPLARASSGRSPSRRSG